MSGSIEPPYDHLRVSVGDLKPRIPVAPSLVLEFREPCAIQLLLYRSEAGVKTRDAKLALPASILTQMLEVARSFRYSPRRLSLNPKP